MEQNLLPLPVEVENANAKFDNRSPFRILIFLGAFLLSFAAFVFFLEQQSKSMDEYNILFQIAVIALSIAFIFFTFIWTVAFIVIKYLPPEIIYKITDNCIKIRNTKSNDVKIFSNQNILSLDSIDDEFIIHTPNESFKLPKIVNPIGSGIKLIVLPFSRHVGLTSLRLHKIVLIDGKINIERFWSNDIKSSKYPT